METVGCLLIFEKKISAGSHLKKQPKDSSHGAFLKATCSVLHNFIGLLAQLLNICLIMTVLRIVLVILLAILSMTMENMGFSNLVLSFG